jgi:peroxin-6
MCRILKAQTRKYKLHENVSLLSIAQQCPPNFTGADIYALCADAWYHAAKNLAKTLEADPSRTSEASADDVIVEINDFMTVLGDITPSLSIEELQNYEQLRKKIEGPSR